MPNGKYRGQKLTKLVSTKMPASANSTYPTVPEIIFPINKPVIIAAIMILIILSADPMFGIIVFVLRLRIKYNTKMSQ
jgi:hypothetical protein